MAKHVVICRYCGKEFDTNPLVEEVDWIRPSRNYYYHVSCYEFFKSLKRKGSKEQSDKEWHELIYDYIAHDLKKSYDFFKCENQLKKFVETDKIATYKGIFFTLKYFYEVKKGEWEKGYGGVGIVPYVYKEATEYWVEVEKKKKGTLLAIEEQLKSRAAQQTVTRKRTSPPKKKKEKWNLEDIE